MRRRHCANSGLLRILSDNVDAAVGAVDRRLDLGGALLLGYLFSLRLLADAIQEGHIGLRILFYIIFQDPILRGMKIN